MPHKFLKIIIAGIFIVVVASWLAKIADDFAKPEMRDGHLYDKQIVHITDSFYVHSPESPYHRTSE